MVSQSIPIAHPLGKNRISLPFPSPDHGGGALDDRDSGIMSLDRPETSHTKKNSLGAVSVSSSMKTRLKKAVASFNPPQVPNSHVEEQTSAGGTSSGSISMSAQTQMQTATGSKSALKETEHNAVYASGALVEELDETSSDTASSVYSDDDTDNESDEKDFPMTVPSTFGTQIHDEINLTKLTVPPPLKTRANPSLTVDRNVQPTSGTGMGTPVSGDFARHEIIRNAPVGGRMEDVSLPHGRSETLVPRRHVVRIERDYSNGMVVQYLNTFPSQLRGRITIDQFQKSIGILNNLFELADGSSFAHFIDNFLAVVTIYTSQLFLTSQYEKRMKTIREFISSENERLYNPAGLVLKDPGHNGFLNIEIEII